MRFFCPNLECKEHDNPSDDFYIKKGYFKTKHNHQPVPRYQCKTCGTKFSSHTFRDTLNQKKPYLNEEIFKLYSSGMTLRRLAKVLKCHQQTVANKLIFLGSKCVSSKAENRRNHRCWRSHNESQRSLGRHRLFARYRA